MSDSVDVFVAANICKEDTLLQIGNINVPTKDRVRKSKQIKSVSDLNSSEKFSKILVNGVETNTNIQKICKLNSGLIVFFVGTYGAANHLANQLECDYYPCNTWKVDTDMGICVVTDAHGESFRSQVEKWDE